MISKMKKYSFLIFHKEYENFLLKLRELGAVHVQEKQSGEIASEELTAIVGKVAEIKDVEDFLIPYSDSKWNVQQESPSVERGKELIGEVKMLRNDLEKINQRIPSIRKEIDLMKVWGDFKFSAIEALRKAGYEISFYVCSPKDYRPEWESMHNAIIIDNNGATVHFVTVSHAGEEFELPVEKAKLSRHSLSELGGMLDAAEAEKKKLVEKLRYICNSCHGSLAAYKNSILSDMEFSKVVLSGEKTAANKVYVLQGWIPEDAEPQLLSFLEREHILYESSAPDLKDSEVPIKLVNNRFARLFEPITRLYSMPNYSEIDVTPFLAPFFMLFFGLCMGDGGYGVLILIACFIAKRKVKPEMKGLCSLGMYLGAMTIVVGILTGAFFGIALDSVEWGWLKSVKQYFLTEKNYKDALSGYNPMMLVAICLGIIQILFGMCLSAVKTTKQEGAKYSYQTIAWVVALVAGIAYGIVAFSGVAVASYVDYIFYVIFGICAIFIYFYNSPGKNILANFGSGLWNTYNMATGLLGDTLSYIRLFAIGLTGGILGGVFNELAFSLTSGLPFVLQFVCTLLILLFGHAINFGLCMISSLVHPLRLIFVEFYKNEGFEGGGKEYKPFRKRQIIE